MNKLIKRALGITLIETMLVLAIAASIIVMSARYFEASQHSSQANAYYAQVQSYITAANNIYQNTGVFPSKTAMEGILPNGANAWNLPWGTAGAYEAFVAPPGFGFSHGIHTPSPATCALIKAKFASNPKIVVNGSNCTSVRYFVNN